MANFADTIKQYDRIMMRQRKKHKYLVVWIPENRWIFHSTNESTYLEVLKWIGGERISKCGLEVSHLPIVTKEPYEQYLEYMKPIGGGWYVNTVGGTDNKYIQLCTMNEKLNLGIIINLMDKNPISYSDRDKLSEWLPDIDIGKKRTREVSSVLCVKYKRSEFLFNKKKYNQILFVNVIELIGINDVCKLGLQAGRYELVTRMKLYDTQLPCGDFWVTVPNATKYRYKILLTIKAILKLDMEVSLLNESQDSASDRKKYSNDLHEIGHGKEHERKKEISGTLYVKYKDLELLFNKGDRNRLLFVLIIELIDINNVYKLGLQTGGCKLVTRMNLYDTQFHYGDFWVTVPSETIYKYNILRTIKDLLKLDMEVSLV